MICAIHQPNFFPWLGYFDKIARADVFVFLDHVDYEKSGHSMQCITNRVSIIGNERIHCPVLREHGPQKIDSVRINNGIPWRDDLMLKIERKYGYSPFWSDVSKMIVELTEYPTETLSELNTNAILRICERIGLTARFEYQSRICPEGRSSALLIDIVKSVNCTSYLHGKGGDKYQDIELFRTSDIELVPQDYEQPQYDQGVIGDFTPGLSILDALFWMGFQKTGEMIKGKTV